MTAVAKSKDRIPVGDGRAALTHSLSGLAQWKALVPAGTAAAPVAAPAAPPAKGPPCDAVARDAVARARKVVLRRERKGHGGKVATRIEGIAGSAEERKALCSQLRKAFGCGAATDGDDLLVQGDQVDRLAAWLAARGAARIVIGS